MAHSGNSRPVKCLAQVGVACFGKPSSLANRSRLVLLGRKARKRTDRFHVAELRDIRHLTEDLRCSSLADAWNRAQQVTLPAKRWVPLKELSNLAIDTLEFALDALEH